MKVAIVKDSGCQPVHSWHDTWKGCCEAAGVDYRVFDSRASAFVSEVSWYLPDIILWRSGHDPAAKRIDAILRQALNFCGFAVVPDWNTHWHYDSKVAQTILFKQFDIPHPKTDIFWDEAEADKYLRLAEYPKVIKADAGAGSKSTRFCFNLEEALTQLSENFGPGLETSGGVREKGLFYCQKYIKADGIFRVVMIGVDTGYSFYQSNRPGTLIASSQGFDSYPPTPPELFDLCRAINLKMGWQYMMYDLIYDSDNKRWLVLELTDTCGFGHSNNRKYTYFYQDGSWVEKEDNRQPAELIFDKFCLYGHTEHSIS